MGSQSSTINLQHYSLLLDEISAEINRDNRKHSHWPIARGVEVVSILCEELGEYAQAVMQLRPIDARKELIQVVAIAINHLLGTGPHFSHD